jgi:transposase
MIELRPEKPPAFQRI